ncbi:MAG: hypothetical protein LBP59_16910 [Planctomycetaceae bacterium]|nr:hypothetical protein [Planctomycetaceae bacterium]
MGTSIQLVLEFPRFKSVKACRPIARQANVNRKLKYEQFKSVKACRPKSRQAKVNENSSANSLKTSFLI